ncbi:MAG: adenosylmethionine decarboxylase [Candidatus Poribacteria bacterium]|nr:adenosylmethionine decarboxylase [Candidatus Poribacteria bacterium]
MTHLGFGPHLVLDGYECSYDALADLSRIYQFLDECPAQIGMTKIMPPHIQRYSGLKPEDWGISGFVMIAESHISIHTFPEKQYLSLDIFSCKAFDIAQAIELVSNAFGIDHYEHQVFDRGREFPHNMRRSAHIVGADRAQVVEGVHMSPSNGYRLTSAR